MSKIDKLEVVEGLIDELRTLINEKVGKLITIIEGCENGEFILSEELLSKFYFIYNI